MQNTHCHGDLTIVPATAKCAKAIKKKLHVLQRSEVSQNRHEVISTALISRWTKDGKEYVSCAKPFVLGPAGNESG